MFHDPLSTQKIPNYIETLKTKTISVPLTFPFHLNPKTTYFYFEKKKKLKKITKFHLLSDRSYNRAMIPRAKFFLIKLLTFYRKQITMF